MERVRYPWIPKMQKRKYWGSQLEAPTSFFFFFFFFYNQIVYAKKATVGNLKQMLTRSLKRVKTTQNVTQIPLYLCIFIGIPWIKGYMQIRNVYCNWLAKNMLHEYISKWFLAEHPANTDTKLWYEGKAVPQVQALALSFPLHEST